MDWKVLLGMFAKPLGAALNQALATGSAAVVAWSVTKGADAGVVTPIVAAFVGALSVTIQTLASTQGVQIPLINNDPNNGVRVVNSVAADHASLPPVCAPIPPVAK